MYVYSAYLCASHLEVIIKSEFSHGPGPHRGHSEDRSQESEVEAERGEVGTIPWCC